MGLEVLIEKEAREYMEMMGGRIMKFVSPGNKGVPDRICFHPAVTPFFIEFKAPREYLKPHQREMCVAMAKLGARIYAGEKWDGIHTIRDARQVIDDEINRKKPRNKIVTSED